MLVYGMATVQPSMDVILLKGDVQILVYLPMEEQSCHIAI